VAVAQVELRAVGKRYPGGVEAVSGLDLTVAEGELLVVVGPSGSGKSTLLRLIAGLESLDEGSLWIGGRRAERLAPRERDVAMVFQNPALYPHLSVYENLAFGLRARRAPRAEILARVEAVADLLAIRDLLGRMPRTLSGGQRQRVALGRAIVRRPGVFLFDEPFSNLDAPLRAATRAELVDLHRRLGATMLFVTHDQAEAMALGDRVAVLAEGRLLQVGMPREVYDRPATRFVAQFLGSPPARVVPGAIEREGEALRFRPAGLDPWPLPRATPAVEGLLKQGSGPIELGLRPEHVLVIGAGSETQLLPESGLLSREIATRLTRLEPLGHETIATLCLGPHMLSTRLPAQATAQVGDSLPVQIDWGHALWFDPGTGRILN
jgi:multiple sugar transport system ATP-binding protein